MKKCLPAALAAVALLATVPAQADDLLTGDVRLACEATLCLSSGERPHECAASLKRYFNIKHRKLKDTLKGRLNFLKLCPASSEPNMPELIHAIAHGAGRCDAAELNRINRATYTKREREKPADILTVAGLSRKCRIFVTTNRLIVRRISSMAGRSSTLAMSEKRKTAANG